MLNVTIDFVNRFSALVVVHVLILNLPIDPTMKILECWTMTSLNQCATTHLNPSDALDQCLDLDCCGSSTTTTGQKILGRVSAKEWNWYGA